MDGSQYPVGACKSQGMESMMTGSALLSCSSVYTPVYEDIVIGIGYDNEI